MSLTPAAERALEWLEQQVHDLAAVRNATARDPVFRNWRQATVTVLQRIWPGDMQRLERFRRIPFSSPNPRAEARAIREAYSRGCQEALRVLQDCIEQVRCEGVMSAPTVEAPTTPDAIVDGIPTLQLPPSPEPAPAPAPPPPAPAEPASTTNAVHAPPQYTRWYACVARMVRESSRSGFACAAAHAWSKPRSSVRHARAGGFDPDRARTTSW